MAVANAWASTFASTWKQAGYAAEENDPQMTLMTRMETVLYLRSICVICG